MSTDTVERVRYTGDSATAPVGRRPAAVVAALTTAKAARSGALWGLVFGLYVTASSLGYAATYKTVQGEDLMFKKSGMGWVVMDAKGDKANITIANVMQSNGVIHVIDTVLLP